MGGHHHHHHSHTDTENIRVAFFVNLAFTLLEVAGGLLTNSIAILSDALHDLGDSLSLGLSWYFQKKAGKGRDDVYTFGYRRFSLLGAVINSMVLIIGSVFVLREAIPRLWEPQTTHAPGMLALSVVGILFNGYAYYRLQKGSSLNERTVSLHLLEDVLGWVAVMVGSIFIYFFEWYILDPLLSLGITFFVLINIYKNLRESFRVFLQGKPADTDMEDLQKEVEALSDVQAAHDLHVWSLDGEYKIATLHVVTANEDIEERKQLKRAIRRLFKEKGIEHVTVEIDSPDEDCEMEDCI